MEYTAKTHNKSAQILLKHISDITLFADKKRIGEIIEHPPLKEAIQHVQSFYQLECPETVPQLCIILSYAIRSSSIDKKKVFQLLGDDINDAYIFNKCHQELVVRNLIVVLEKDGHIRSRSHFDGRLCATSKCLDATLENDPTKIKSVIAESFEELVLELSEHFIQMKDGIMSADTYYSVAENILSKSQHLDFFKNAPQVNTWPKHEKHIFLHMCYLYIFKSVPDVSIYDILDDFFDSNSAIIDFRKQLDTQTTHLQKEDIWDYSVEPDFRSYILTLTEHGLSFIDPYLKSNKFHQATRVLIAEPYTNIVEEPLFFNPKEENQLNEIETFLYEPRLKELQKRLHEGGMTGGICILLHGFPGTGKTATAHQWARKTERDLLKMDVSHVRDKWVGESEKNLSKIFKEYKKVSKNAKKLPILLFNEADALLSKRTEIRYSTDQTFNSIQNMLLQELEEFEGILVATTNLTSSLDKAFERRFLFKIELQKPSSLVRAKILQNRLPELEESKANYLAEKYHLSGGQLMNVHKKVMINQLLYPEKNWISQLEEWMEQETIGLEGSKHSSIGFQVKN